MKGNFFKQFKEYLLDEQKDRLKSFIPYYETAFQARDKLKVFLDDVEKHHLEIRYEDDTTEGYTQGTFEFHLYEKDPNKDYGWESACNHYYKMELRYNDRMWGYCECSPEYEDYNPVHDCCGNGCDWSAPEIVVTKIEGVAFHPFEGVERDLWKLEEEWEQDEVDHEEKIRLAHLKRIEDEIKYLEEQRNQYIK